MDQNNTYKYLSVVLAIIAIVFAVLYFTKDTPVSETYNEISADVQGCWNQLFDWQRVNGTLSTTTEQARNDLMSILEDCQDTFEDTEKKL